MPKRTVFFLSNRTAITAETLGHSLLAQFKDMDFEEITVPYIDSSEKAEQAVAQICDAAQQDQQKPIVFSTLAEPEIRRMITDCNDALVMDLFHAFLPHLEQELQIKPLLQKGRSHRISDVGKYESRIDAINFTLQHDDGAYTKHYDQSDIILIGVSRSGKTPTCLYLALQFGICAANYPITEEDLDSDTLPAPLRPYMHKLYGLTTDPQRLQDIRQERRPNSRYASLEQCRHEIRATEELFITQRVPYLNSSTMSVEEIATRIVEDRGLHRHGY